MGGMSSRIVGGAVLEDYSDSHSPILTLYWGLLGFGTWELDLGLAI